MKIYLFRHAQKAMDFSGDPDLTVEGHAQASRLLDKVLKNELPTPTELWVSPKKRTYGTFRPLSQHFNLPMIATEGLLEQQADETISQLRKRVENIFAEAASKKDSVIFMCTHYDVVIEAMNTLACSQDLTESEFSHWAPCQYIGLSTAGDGFFEFIEFKRIAL